MAELGLELCLAQFLTRMPSEGFRPGAVLGKYGDTGESAALSGLWRDRNCLQEVTGNLKVPREFLSLFVGAHFAQLPNLAGCTQRLEEGPSFLEVAIVDSNLNCRGWGAEEESPTWPPQRMPPSLSDLTVMGCSVPFCVGWGMVKWKVEYPTS